MARSINSPGVQITETDLSQYQQIVGGTTVFVPGFAPQGPIDEVLLVTSVSEFEQIYGTPQTPAERYFYHTSKEILNSPATLLTTRLPYGSGFGEGFADQYSALLYPVASGADTFTLGAPTYRTLTEEEYNDIIQNNVTWGSLSNSISSVTTVSTETSSVTLASELTAGFIQKLSAVDTTPETYGIYYNDDNTVTITFEYQLSSTQFIGAPGTATFTNNVLNAGLVVINNSQTAANELFEGYYLSITDNSEFGAGTDFTAIQKLYGLVGSEELYEVPTTRLAFALSGAKDTAGSSSVSEIIEGVVDFTLNQPYYNDTILVNLFKVRSSIYEPQALTISLVESHLGSLNSNKKSIADVGGTPKSFYLETIINSTSNNLKAFVNPNISTKINWTNKDNNDPKYSVRTNQGLKALYPDSVYIPSYKFAENKEVGNVYDKVARALTLVETPETAQLDVVVDSGLTTIYTNASAKSYDDTIFANTVDLNIPSSPTITKYKAIFSLFNDFVTKTRKDCVFIGDPLRQIFVNGENTKTLSLRNKVFSTHIFNPLKASLDTVNSNYSVTYGNWVKGYDTFSDKQVWLPFSGFAAAAFARTDRFAQPWIAPAGLTRGTISGIVDIAFNPNQKQRDFLYTLSINPVVFFPNDGFVIFGQKTLQNKPSAFDRINVRRLFLSLERATQNALRFFVFEPNTEFTRTRVKNTITPIFELAKNTEGLYDYLIVCDERNNTPDVIDRNELAVDIYIKPVKAAEFILVNFIATRTGQNFQELI